MENLSRKELLDGARDRAEALLELLKRDQASLTKLPGGSADEGRAAYAAAVDAAAAALDNLRRASRERE
jgi:hypothetical protein